MPLWISTERTAAAWHCRTTRDFVGRARPTGEEQSAASYVTVQGIGVTRRDVGALGGWLGTGCHTATGAGRVLLGYESRMQE